MYTTTGIDYTTGLIIAVLLLVILWCLIKVDQRKEANAREKMLNEIGKEMDEFQKEMEGK